VAARTSAVVLTPLQRRLRLLEHRTPARGYRVRALFRIDAVDASNLTTHLRHVVERHPVLHGVPLSVYPLTMREVAAARTTLAAGLPDLEDGDRLRGMVGAGVSASDGSRPCFLLLTLPASCADLQTLRRIAHEASLACAGHPPPSGESLTYGQVLDWHRELLTAPEFAAGRRYWHDREAVWRAVPAVPADGPAERRDNEPCGPRVTSVPLPPDLMRTVAARARETDRTVESCLLAAFIAELQGLGPLAELAMPTAYSGRSHRQLTDVVGPLRSYLPVHVKVAPARSFDDLWQDVWAACEETATYQLYAGASTFDALNDLRLATGFEYEPWPEAWSIGPVTWAVVAMAWRLERFQTLLSVTGPPDALAVRWFDEGDWGDGERATRLLTRYCARLAEAMTRPDLPLARLAAVRVAERIAPGAGWPGAHPTSDVVIDAAPSTLAGIEEWTRTEARLADLYRALLKRSEIGRHDSFFDLGGNSLFVVIVVSRIREAFGIELPLRLIFDDPRVSSTAAAIDALQQQSRDHEAIARVPRDRALALSFGQERLWFLARLDPESSAYNLAWAIDLRGRLDRHALETALNTLVERHEVLRTSFPEREGQPVQVIHPFTWRAMPVVDLSTMTEEARTAVLREAVATNAGEPYDLLTGPVLRCTLVRLAFDHHVLLLGAPHIVCDGWSLRIVTSELSAIYNTAARGQVPRLEPLATQYADYAAWQRRQLDAAAIDGLLGYWRARLADYPGVLDLPTDFVRPSIIGSRGAAEPIALPADTAAALRTFCARHHVTLFMATAAAFLLLLSRYARTEDVAIGTPVANRTRREIEPLVGFFVNSMVMRARIDPAWSFAELVAQIRRWAVADYEHAALPFETLVQALQPKRDLSRSPLFQVMFSCEDAAPELLELVNLEMRWVQAARTAVKVELSLDLIARGAAIEGAFSYSTELFTARTVGAIAGHYATLLRHLLDMPDRPVGDVPLMTDAERRAVIAHGIGRREPFAGAPTVHRLVEAQAERMPDRIAFACEARTLTYAEANGRANSLARELQRLGVGPGWFVPVVMTNSLELPLAFLAVLKTGAAYLPVDPDWPAARRAEVMAAARCELMLVNPPCAALADTRGTPAALVVDAAALQATSRNLDVAVDGDAAIYCMFTSGSTGRPKGAVNLHRGIRNRLCYMNRFFGRADREVVLQTCAPTFDSYMWQVFWPAINGATCVLSPPGAALDLIGTIQQIAASRATFIDMVPSVFNVMADCLDARPELCAELRSLRHLLLGGETLRAEAVRRVLARLPDLTITGTYGPTETSIGVMFFPIETPPYGRIPIGHPIDNTAAILLDERRHPVPHGVPGEICLGGDCVGAGYVNDREATARVFIPNPVAELPAAMLYRTGDLARVNPRGEFEFLGRIDNQVKVSGIRIEPGEVEAALFQHPGVQNAAVYARRDGAGTRRLLASVAPKAGVPLTAATLRAHLAARVPQAMMPVRIHLLPELPITATGKVDRHRLPDVDAPRCQAEEHEAPTAIEQPEDQIEFRMVTIWEELLDVRPIGVTDDFFQLGGSSLMVIRLLFHIRERLGVTLRVAALFEHTTIRSLAAVIRQQGGAVPWTPLVPIQRRGTKPPLFVVHPIGGTVFCYRALSNRLGPDQPVVGIQAPPLHEATTEGTQYASLREMASDYVDLVRATQPAGPYYLVGWSFGGTVAFEMACELERRGESAGLVAILDTKPPTLASEDFEEDDTTLAWALAWERGVITGRGLGLTLDELRDAAPDARDALILSRMQEAGLAPPEADVGILRAYLAGYRRRSHLSSSYEPGMYGGVLTLFRARDVEPQFARAGVATRVEDYLQLWQRAARAPVHLIEVPGSHATLGQEPHIAVIAKTIAACMAHAPADCVWQLPAPAIRGDIAAERRLA
jgi:amino acid adenylation domain-containing protein